MRVPGNPQANAKREDEQGWKLNPVTFNSLDRLRFVGDSNAWTVNVLQDKKAFGWSIIVSLSSLMLSGFGVLIHNRIWMETFWTIGFLSFIVNVILFLFLTYRKVEKNG